MNPLDQLGEALAEVEELGGQAPGLPARVLSPQQAGEMDLAGAEHAAGEFLRALGMDLGAVHLQRTPARMAQAWAQMLTPRDFTFTTFPNEEHYDELVVLRDNPVRPVCGHHLLPFTGRAGVGYLPGERSVGLSKLARIVEHFACRPRTQERLTQQFADWLRKVLSPRAVGVVISAEHSCMSLRGANIPGTSTVTSALLGHLRDNAGARQEFLSFSGLMNN
ncbi:GTP cyclohydrolase I FolE [Glutamicibacter soli]|uniref:GTP cyclohydrolase 1 n=1 Tax=Glutamicibacter soli TaxID=453836 RepID=A0A365Y7K5_9MICC|nr:GTP cyclohydrolase I [Glutamicibacter soli]RBL98650.1 GTP cyclohydrolase I FolE [Glutamicibacter soli]